MDFIVHSKAATHEHSKAKSPSWSFLCCRKMNRAGSLSHRICSDSSLLLLPETKREVSDRTSVWRGKPVTYRQKASGLLPEESLTTRQTNGNPFLPSRSSHGNSITDCPKKKQNGKTGGSSDTKDHLPLQPGSCKPEFLKPSISTSASINMVTVFQMVYRIFWRYT